MVTLPKIADASTEQDGFKPLPLSFFRSQLVPPIDTFAVVGEDPEPRLLASDEVGLSEADLDRLEREGVAAIYVRAADHDDLSRELFDSLDEIVESDAMEPAERFIVLQSLAACSLTEAFHAKGSEAFVDVSEQLGSHIAKLTSSDELASDDLFRLAAHDVTTFVHATNVTAYASLLAKGLGITNPEELAEIATGAMLHDIGKRHLPRDVLTKPGRLNADERALIERHPQLGYEDLHARGNLSFGQRMMVYQHHEHLDGNGYPVGIVGDEIHPWAKLMAVVDVFDAVTAHRPYRKGMSQQEAVEMISENAGTQFDTEMVACWASLSNQ